MHLFDLDGTLIDSNGLWQQIDLAFLGQHGLKPTQEYVEKLGHSTFPVAAQYTKEYYHLDMTPRAIMDQWLEMAGQAYRGGTLPLKPGAAQLLEQLHGAGRSIALMSACFPDMGRAILARHGLLDYFQRLIFSQELGLDKGDPAVFLQSAQLLEVAPEQCTLYDDNPAACAAARAAGMTVVGVYDPFYHHAREKMPGICHRYVDSLELLLA